MSHNKGKCLFLGHAKANKSIPWSDMQDLSGDVPGYKIKSQSQDITRAERIKRE